MKCNQYGTTGYLVIFIPNKEYWSRYVNKHNNAFLIIAIALSDNTIIHRAFNLPLGTGGIRNE